MTGTISVGIVGGAGELGGAVARALLRSRFVEPGRLWISNRSGRFAGFDDWPGVRLTTLNQELADACEMILLSVPPHLAPSVGIDANNQLVLSVMAGVSLEQIAEYTRAQRVVRAMSNPAADLGLAYSPWCASPAVTDEDRSLIRGLFQACGVTDEVPTENQIEYFTALTGPVPGFVAYYADCMIACAVQKGIARTVAERAIRQLFHASGIILAQEGLSPSEHVRQAIDYGGTTAAGLETMRASSIAASIERGLEAAYQRTRRIASDA